MGRSGHPGDRGGPSGSGGVGRGMKDYPGGRLQTNKKGEEGTGHKVVGNSPSRLPLTPTVYGPKTPALRTRPPRLPTPLSKSRGLHPRTDPDHPPVSVVKEPSGPCKDSVLVFRRPQVDETDGVESGPGERSGGGVGGSETGGVRVRKGEGVKGPGRPSVRYPYPGENKEE